MTNASQAVTASLTLSAFGQTVAGSGSSTSAYGFGATSGYRMEGDAGLTLVGCWFYDAQVGRFLTRDTYLDQAPYAYCDGDPVNATDPSGHETWWQKGGQAIASGWNQFGGAIKGTFLALTTGLAGIGLWGAWDNMMSHNKALANERRMLNDYEQTHPDADMSKQWELYQYMQNGTLKSDANFAAKAGSQYLHGAAGVR